MTLMILSKAIIFVIYIANMKVKLLFFVLIQIKKYNKIKY